MSKGDKRRKFDMKKFQDCPWIPSRDKDNPIHQVDPEVAQKALVEFLYPEITKTEEK